MLRQFALGDFVSLTTLRDAVFDLINPGLRDPSAPGNGVAFADLALVSGAEMKLAHGLKRGVQGWSLTRKSTHADVCESRAPTDEYLYLAANADVTISLKVW